MHTKMLVCLLFFMFEISAGITEFPCKFPCEWRNKTFNINGGTWKFSSDGETSIYGGSVILRCHQITERFLIVRMKQEIDDYVCFTIFYDIGSPVKFKFLLERKGDFTNHTGEFTDICVICGANDVAGEGSTGVVEAVESGTPATLPPVNSVPCTIPSTCTSPPTGILCDASDIIPRGNCPDTTTESPDTTTEQTTTITEATTTKPTKRHCRKKHKHRK
ncbi:uncharacterized protein [Mytilus edulis]|uniref:uncharacterized protein n=1 Tax=Mytilus edulis TaxID=6550 RepID=UPI0039EE04A0